MQETPVLRRKKKNKYNRLIQSVMIVCSVMLIVIPPMQQVKNETMAKEIEKTTKKVETIEIETVDISAGVGKRILPLSQKTLPVGESLQLSKKPQVEKLEVETVNSASDTEQEVAYKTLEEVKISRNMDLTETTGMSRKDFCELLADFKYDYDGFYERNAGLIWDLSQKYQVNEIFICGVFALESYYGSDDRHVRTHNYGSIMTGGGELVQYANDTEGIEANFKLFANSYLASDGKYYKGVTLDAIGDTYCPPTKECPSWADQVYSCMKVFF